MADAPENPTNAPSSNGTSSSQKGIGHVIDQRIDRELHESYLTYAMSTILDRALPDVRDGLKPSQRRILVAMNDLNLSPGRKHRKCAKIAGDTSGNYHPHGESVIYPTLVNMGQGWKMRVPLVDKQGNFGSIDGDPPAAMRYTEARMTQGAVELLDDLKLDTVDFKANYDETREEPTVLPGRLPNLLLNGSSGIAVGMACSSPPHNVREILDAIVACIDNPQITFEDLVTIVQGPDFPTGGVIAGKGGILQAYATGRGRIYVRGRVHVEEQNGRSVLVIDEIPYQLVQNSLIERIVDAAKSGRIDDIADIKNFSGKKHRTRIMVYLKRGADPEVVEKQLYRFTPLQSTYSIINIALVNGRPKTLSLRETIECYIDHRRTVIRRRTEHLLREARRAAHRLEGLIFAVCDIDEVIELIRSSRTREEAILRLRERRFQIAADHEYASQIPSLLIDRAADQGIALSKLQAEAIGALRLIQLVGLEIEKLTTEYASLLEKINGYETILAEESRVSQIIRDDCASMRATFGEDRQTTIEEVEDEAYDRGALIQEHPVVVTISHRGYVKRLPIDTYREQARGGRGVKGTNAREDDFTEHLFVASSHDDLLCFTNSGRVFKVKVYDIPEMSRTAGGRAIVNLLRLKEDETIVNFLAIKDFEESEDFLVFGTAHGRVKRTAVKEYHNVNVSGIRAIKLGDGDRLIGTVLTTGEDDVLLATRQGMSIRFHETDARAMGRVAAGVKGIALSAGDEVVGLVRGADECDLLTVTDRGYGKRTAMSEYLVQLEDGSCRRQRRGGKGRKDIRTNERNGEVVAIRCIQERDSVVFVSEQGMMVRIPTESIRRIGRNTQGVRLVNLKDGDTLQAAARIADQGDDAPDSPEVAAAETTDAT
jgi:DNA gyrase subunit A